MKVAFMKQFKQLQCYAEKESGLSMDRTQDLRFARAVYTLPTEL